MDGCFCVSNAGVDFANPGKHTFPVMPVSIGAAVMVGSIPLFIASAKNNGKAKAVTTFLKIERVPGSQKTSLISQRFPSIAQRLVYNNNQLIFKKSV